MVLRTLALGAAMATIMASRCLHDEELNDPVELLYIW